MNKYHVLKDATIGLSDGLVIPFALAAGLSNVSVSSPTIVAACLVAAMAGAVTMTFSGYLEGTKYKTSVSPLRSALIIGVSYALGGVLVTLPYHFMNIPGDAFRWSALLTLSTLFCTGYVDHTLHGGKGWQGGIRTVVTGAVAATPAGLVSGGFI